MRCRYKTKVNVRRRDKVGIGVNCTVKVRVRVKGQEQAQGQSEVKLQGPESGSAGLEINWMTVLSSGSEAGWSRSQCCLQGPARDRS